ncbi:MAG: EscU/YscU/HrcU family type III secretion system export apparatus switch protein, partial [Hyphomicrobium sp.]
MAEEQDKDSRTEEATDKRLGDARSDGNVPMSREATNFAYLLAALLVIIVLGQTFIVHFTDLLSGVLANVGSIRIDNAGDLGLLFDVVGKSAALITAPIILSFTAAGVLAATAQAPPVPI